MNLLKKKKEIITSLLIFFTAFTCRFIGIKETGGTWDEDVYYNSAYHYYFNLKSLDFSKEAWGWNFEHPPLAKYIYMPAAYISQKIPEDSSFRPGVNLFPLRLVSAFMGAFTCTFVFLISLKVFKNYWAGVFAGVILAFLPQFVAYGKLVSLESAQVLFLTGALYFFLKDILVSEVKWDSGIKKLITKFLPVALFSAAAFATRFSSGLLFPWMGLVLLIKAIDTKKKQNFALAFTLPFLFLVLGFALLVLFWPWLWQNPLDSFIKSFTFSQQHFNLSDLQPFYYFKFIVITTPVVVLLLFTLGVRELWMVKGEPTKHVRFLLAAFLLWILVFGGQGLTGLKGGGVRYALMTIPVVAIVAGLGASIVVNHLSKFSRSRPAPTSKSIKYSTACLFVLSFYLFASSLTVYPYLMDYYSELVGSAKGAYYKGLPLGFRGEGIKRTIEWLNANAKPNSTVFINAAPDEAARLRADLQRQESPSMKTNYYVILPSSNFIGGWEWKLIYEEKVAGVAPLCSIYENTDPQ